MSNDKEKVLAAFDDKRNIAVGAARVIWAKSVEGWPEGWVKLGGGRIADEFEARAYAARLSQLIRA